MNTAVVIKNAKARASVAEPLALPTGAMSQIEAYLSHSIHALASIEDDSVEGEALRGLLALADLAEDAVTEAMRLRTDDAGMEAGDLLSQLISLIAIVLDHRDDGKWDTLGAVQGCLQYTAILLGKVREGWK